MKISDLLKEMATWFTPSKELIEKAETSNITTKNNKQFNQLVKGWSDGLFDEDPRLVMDEIEWILNK